MIERVVMHDPAVGPIVCLRDPRARREASASRLGVFEWNRNFGTRAWWRVPQRALEGRAASFHIRSELRRRIVSEYRALAGAPS